MSHGRKTSPAFPTFLEGTATGNAITLANGSLQYDAFGRRVTNAAGTSFLYDGLNPVQELSGATPTANMLTGFGVDEFFSRTDSSGGACYLSDALGSTVALADSTGSTLPTIYTYEPFGNTTARGAASSNPYQFTGRENDGNGLYFIAIGREIR